MLNLFKRRKISPNVSEFAQQLDALDYFSLIKENKQSIIDKFIELYTSNPNLLPVMNEDHGDKIVSLDHRSYFVEAINLYDVDAVSSFLNEIKQTMIQLNIPFDIKEHEGGWNSEKLEYNQSIKINNHKYELLNHFHTSYICYAMYKIAEMINDVLIKNNSQNKLYLAGWGEISAWYFLTQAQYEYVYNKVEKLENKPLAIDHWEKLAEKGQIVYFRNQE